MESVCSRYKRFLDLHYEISRLECVLFTNMVSQKMFNELVIKLSILEKEFFPGYFSFSSTEKANEYKSMTKKHYKKLSRMYSKFRLGKCSYCGILNSEQSDEICVNDDCPSNSRME